MSDIAAEIGQTAPNVIGNDTVLPRKFSAAFLRVYEKFSFAVKN
jgi:hypothetical protein